MASKNQPPNLYSGLLMHVPTNTHRHTTHMGRWVGRKRRRRGRVRERRRCRRGRGGGGSCLMALSIRNLIFDI